MILFALLLAIHLTSILLAGWRLRARPAARGTAPACLIVPVRGIDHFAAETLVAFLEQDHPDHRIFFCVEDADDPVIPLLHRLIAARGAHAPKRAEVLIGRDPISHNPKLNNMVKGWRHDDTEWVAMIDSNALPPPDYLSTLLGAHGPRTGLVTSPAIGIRPQGVWAQVEAAFLNTHQARWQFLADLFGRGFAQGKTLFWHRPTLTRAGGLAPLGRELAEDVAATKLVHSLGLTVRLAPRPIPQPIGPREFAAVWDRQLRWSRIRRLGFFWLFLPELLLGGAVPLGALALTYPILLPPAAALWYGAEWALARANGWPRSVAAMILRDLLFPALWLWSWKSRSIAWRGQVLAPTPG